MQEILGISKAKQGKLVRNTSKIKEFGRCINKDSKKFKEVQSDPIYPEE